MTMIDVDALDGYAGCVWPIDPSCLEDAYTALPLDTRQRAVTLASATLSRLTAYRVGNCPITARPAPQSRSCAVPLTGFYGSFIPGLFQGQWVNTTATHLSASKDLQLPGPIHRLDGVTIDGTALDIDDFVVYDQNTITYVGADRDFSWPLSQDFSLLDTEVGTFSVTYLNSAPVDAQGALAAGIMTMEYAKACASATGKCRLPSNITTLTRNGLSLEMIVGAFPDGVTGIREVDDFIARWNPKGRPPVQFFDPGAPRHRVQTS